MSEQINHKDRDHALLSASSSSRWLACPPSAVANEAYPNQDTSFTQEGTLAHEVAEIIARTGTLNLEEAKVGVNKEMVDCAELPRLHRGAKEKVTTQPSFSSRVDFSEWVPEGFGTCDCIIIQDDTLTIIDYNTVKALWSTLKTTRS